MHSNPSLTLPKDPKNGILGGMKVVLLNGPPGSGKDTAGRVLSKHFGKSRVMKFARRLKESVHADYGAPELPHDFFEAIKHLPNDFFFGKTPRQAYIDKSERMVKPVLGRDFYGKIFLRDMRQAFDEGVDLVFITDSGFESEIEPVLRELDSADNMLLVRIHAEERGKTFAGDSRSYLEIPYLSAVDLYNVELQVTFEEKIVDVVGEWLCPEPY